MAEEIATDKTQVLWTHACQSLKGIGPKLNQLFVKCGVLTLADLLMHFPSRYLDRTRVTKLKALRAGDYAVLDVQVIEQGGETSGGKRKQWHCLVADETGRCILRFYYYSQAHQKALTVGQRVQVFGEVVVRRHGLEIVHPEYHLLTKEETFPGETCLTPIYSSTEGLTQKVWREAIRQALVYLDVAPWREYLPGILLEKYDWPDINKAFSDIHFPMPNVDQAALITGTAPACQRFAFEELLNFRLGLLSERKKIKQQSAPVFDTARQTIQAFTQTLPFTLTNAQQRAFETIQHDLAQGVPMMRLLQGDVGSGKTVVAALASFLAAKAGYQVALMAPTELLAEQHFANFKTWFHSFELSIVLLTGKQDAKQREINTACMGNTGAAIVIGTHALFQKNVQFNKLGLIIIDEQQRFGVMQREALRDKALQSGVTPHVLSMTATPIPRTLALSIYADQDYVAIDELPPGRTPVKTVVLPNSKRDDIIMRIKDVVAKQCQVYWVCPLIEESLQLQCQAAEATWQILTEQLPAIRIGLLHGRLSADEKENVMQRFIAREIDILVATTVIEVGVDVPNANLMIIENAERFGLAGLHQLRGRVGRGSASSHCVLLYQAPLSEIAKQRLQIMREHQNGFIIADQDLKLRGPGEVLGQRQSGWVTFHIADLSRDQHLFADVASISEQLLNGGDEIQLKGLQARWCAKFANG